jgi:hypothetical protein
MEQQAPLLAPELQEKQPYTDHDKLERGPFETWRRDASTDETHRRPTSLRILNYILPWTIVTILLIDVVRIRMKGMGAPHKLYPSQLTYSPATPEIEYVVKTFDHNLVNSPIEFQHPDTVDQAWKDLYDSECSGLEN